MNTLDREKAVARDRAKIVRKAAAEDIGAADSLVEHARALHELADGGVVAGYAPKGTELDPRPLMLALIGLGCTLALPVMTGPDRAMIFRAWSPSDSLHAGAFGIQEPQPSATEVRPALILTPMLAFDDQGWRLGYGGGYYDRTLEALGDTPPVTVVGVAYAAQRMDAVPHSDQDRPLQWVLTETGLSKLRHT